MLKNGVKTLMDRLGYRLVYSPTDMDEEFVTLQEHWGSNTMVSLEGQYGVFKAVEYLARRDLPGAVVECGVWRGGIAQLCALKLIQEGDVSREFFLYDTFAGMPEPTDRDIHGRGGWSARDRWVRSQTESHNRWIYAPLDAAQRVIESTGYPAEKIHFLKGLVEETIPETVPEEIAFLHLDTDWYASTKHELEHLWPRVVPGGVLIIDDYGGWEGARQAVDEYFGANPILLSRLDWSVRMAIKAS